MCRIINGAVKIEFTVMSDPQLKSQLNQPWCGGGAAPAHSVAERTRLLIFIFLKATPPGWLPNSRIGTWGPAASFAWQGGRLDISSLDQSGNRSPLKMCKTQLLLLAVATP